MKKTALPLYLKNRPRSPKTRPAFYAGVILAAVLAAEAYKIRTDTLFSCPANGYTSDYYLAYCAAAGYGDYEHGAFQFDLEPSAEDFVRKADVLFLGSSYLQAAFSTAATSDWFSAAPARYYLLGFTYFENVSFAEQLLRRIRPHPKVYIIDVDGFFKRTENPLVKKILHDPGARNRYQEKHWLQLIHKQVCKRFSALCGDKTVIFRSRETGAYFWWTRKLNFAPVSYDPVVSQDLVAGDAASAAEFLSHLGVERKCVILTIAPRTGTKVGEANAVAKALGASLIAPDIRDRLETFDGDHLAHPSAERWSQAFFEAAGQRIRACLKQQQQDG